MARRTLLATLMLTLGAAGAMAQEVRLYGARDAVDPHDVAAILGQPLKMRSIRLLDGPPAAAGTSPQLVAVAPRADGPSAAPEAYAAKAPAADPPGALALPVQFAFASAEILPSARQQLDALAEGILLLPTGQSVVIEGHTDAAGEEQYNEQLSQRRAFAVKRYLVAAHHVDPARLRAVGMGEFAPLPGRNPYAGENRRVQFRGE